MQTQGSSGAGDAFRLQAARILLRATQPDQREAISARHRRVCEPCERDDSAGLTADEAHKVKTFPPYSVYLERQNRDRRDPTFEQTFGRTPAESAPARSPAEGAPSGRPPYAGPSLADVSPRATTPAEARLHDVYQLRVFAPSGRLVDLLV